MKKNGLSNICKLVLIGLTLVSIHGCKKEDSTNEANTIKDIDGNVYLTVTIGAQVWMAEDLKTTRLNDGADIPLVTENNDWNNLTTPGYSWYNNDKDSYGSKYGVLYNWYTVNTNKLCPDGWHVPTIVEWKTLEGAVDSQFGFGDAIWNASGFRGSDVATKLKAASGWSSNGSGTNDFGFSALPSGYRSDVLFLDEGRFNAWWSSTESSESRAWLLSLAFNSTKDFLYNTNKKNGLSVWLFAGLKAKLNLYPS